MAAPFEDHCWQDVVSDEILEIYKAYHRETYVGPNPALLAIDLYNYGYLGGPRPVLEILKDYPNSCGEHAWKAIEPTKRLFAAARAAGLPIIYSRGWHQNPVSSAPHRATNRRASALVEDGFEIFEAFRPEPNDVIIFKERASAFFGTQLVSMLRQLGVDSLIVCGESTSGCVRASVVDAYSYGFHVALVEECCFDRSPLSHKVNLFDMHHKYADVLHLDSVLQHLEGLRAAQ